MSPREKTECVQRYPLGATSLSLFTLHLKICITWFIWEAFYFYLFILTLFLFWWNRPIISNILTDGNSGFCASGAMSPSWTVLSFTPKKLVYFSPFYLSSTPSAAAEEPFWNDEIAEFLQSSFLQPVTALLWDGCCNAVDVFGLALVSSVFCLCS